MVRKKKSRIPTGWRILQSAGSREVANKIKSALKKENPRKSYKTKKLGYREFAILGYKFGPKKKKKK